MEPTRKSLETAREVLGEVVSLGGLDDRSAAPIALAIDEAVRTEREKHDIQANHIYEYASNMWEGYMEEAQQANAERDGAEEKRLMRLGNCWLDVMNLCTRSKAKDPAEAGPGEEG